METWLLSIFLVIWSCHKFSLPYATENQFSLEQITSVFVPQSNHVDWNIKMVLPVESLWQNTREFIICYTMLLLDYLEYGLESPVMGDSMVSITTWFHVHFRWLKRPMWKLQSATGGSGDIWWGALLVGFGSCVFILHSFYTRHLCVLNEGTQRCQWQSEYSISSLSIYELRVLYRLKHGIQWQQRLEGPL